MLTYSRRMHAATLLNALIELLGDLLRSAEVQAADWKADSSVYVMCLREAITFTSITSCFVTVQVQFVLIRLILCENKGTLLVEAWKVINQDRVKKNSW